MRILHCIPTFEIGGAQRQLSYLAPALAHIGHVVHVAYLRGGPNLAPLERGGVALHRLRSWGNHDPGILFQLVQLIRRVRPDIVQTWILQMDILGGVAAWVTGTPWVLREPSSAAAYPSTTKNSLRRWVGMRADAVLANSEGGQSYWRTVGNPPVCHIIPNGIPVDQIEGVAPASRSDFGVSPKCKLVVFVGRFEEGKNIGNLLSALAMIRNCEPVAAVLAGDGPTRSSIRRAVDRLGISDRVALPGFVADPWALMKCADAFAFLSAFEGLPNAVLEAMACGCPLVVSDIPAHREFLDERCALLVDPDRPEEIAVALQRALSDPAAAQARAKTAKEKVARWSVPWVAGRYEVAYRNVLEIRRCLQ